MGPRASAIESLEGEKYWIESGGHLGLNPDTSTSFPWLELTTIGSIKSSKDLGSSPVKDAPPRNKRPLGFKTFVTRSVLQRPP